MKNSVAMEYSSFPIDTHGSLQDLTPLSLLIKLANSQVHGCLQVLSGQVSWLIYFEQGKIIYASHSIEPLERLDRHLRRFGCKVSDILKEVYPKSCLQSDDSEKKTATNLDYLTICWLVNKHYLDAFKAAELIDSLVKEVIESFAWIEHGIYNFFNQPIELPKLARIEVKSLNQYCQDRLPAWQSLGDKIWSPYQRPYLFRKSAKDQKILPDLQNKLSSVLEQRLWTLLKGFNFKQLALLLNQDEIKIAESLQPYIVDGTILLREPQPPFDKLPKIPKPYLEPEARLQGISTSASAENTTNIAISLAPPVSAPTPDKPNKYTVVCVDDSPTILTEISHFLDDKSFAVFTISDPVKALMQILRIKPDIVLLDVGMPHIDGYGLCRLLRNNSAFKNTPIVMVTGNTGLIDRAKAKVAGASGYLTKPFTQSELLKTMFRHLD